MDDGRQTGGVPGVSPESLRVAVVDDEEDMRVCLREPREGLPYDFDFLKGMRRRIAPPGEGPNAPQAVRSGFKHMPFAYHFETQAQTRNLLGEELDKQKSPQWLAEAGPDSPGRRFHSHQREG
jgi:hypothetical protein